MSNLYFQTHPLIFTKLFGKPMSNNWFHVETVAERFFRIASRWEVAWTIFPLFRHKRYSFAYKPAIFSFQIHQKSCKGLTKKLPNTNSSTLPNTSNTNNVPSNAPIPPVAPPAPPAASPVPPNGTLPNSLDYLMMNSPLLMRRTLHKQDDTVITTSANYEETMLKQIQPLNPNVEDED